MKPQRARLATARAVSAQRVALAIGIAGSIASAFAAWDLPQRFFPSWLFAWLFALGIGLGAMVMVMVHEVTGGVWGFAIRRPLEAALRTMPLILLLALPLAWGLPTLYPWARGDAGNGTTLLAAKRWFLEPGFFGLRSIVYAAIWLALAWTLQNYWSRGETNAGEVPHARLRALAIAGLIAYALTVTLASVDWIMSLSLEWYSTAFGILIMTSQAVGGYVLAVAWAAASGEIERCVDDVRAATQDLGNVLLTLVMLWAYIAFTQFLVIWAADLPHEIGWYLVRATPSWKAVAVTVFALQFALPFVAMLFRSFKREPRRLAALCVAILLAHALEMLWLVAPGFRAGTAWFDWTDLAALACVGGLCGARFLACIASVPSVRAPRPSPPGVTEHG